MSGVRRFKVVECGMTVNCATHNLDEAARELLNAAIGGYTIQIRYGNGRELTERDARAVAVRAAEMSITRGAAA